MMGKFIILAAILLAKPGFASEGAPIELKVKLRQGPLVTVPVDGQLDPGVIIDYPEPTSASDIARHYAILSDKSLTEDPAISDIKLTIDQPEPLPKKEALRQLKESLEKSGLLIAESPEAIHIQLN